MKKKWKIMLGIFIIFSLLVISYVIFILNETSFYKNAELSYFRFGSSDFNSKLSNCELSYFQDYNLIFGVEISSWEIRGIKDEKCKVYLKEIDENSPFFNCYNYEECENMAVYYKFYSCKIPYSIYSKPEKINWIDLFNNKNYCEIYVNEDIKDNVEENTYLRTKESKNISIKETKNGYIYETMLEDGIVFVWCKNEECPEGLSCMGSFCIKKNCSTDEDCDNSQICCAREENEYLLKDIHSKCAYNKISFCEYIKDYWSY